MKTVFLSLVCSFLFLTINVNASTVNPLSNPAHLDNWEEAVNDSPYSYAARIKRFHRPYQGFDYFSPAYIDVNNYSSIFTLGTTIYNGTPYEYSKFKDWNRLIGNIFVYRYYQDEFYRKRVDMWNRIYNPNWNQTNSFFNPFGSFNFGAAFGLAGNPPTLHAGNLSTLYVCPPNYRFYDYLNNNDLVGILNGNQLPPTGSLTVSTDSDNLKPNSPIPPTPFITKKIRQDGTIKSIKKSVVPNEDFYSHVTLKTRKRLPKNWRTLPSALRAWYESPEIAPPSVAYTRALQTASQEKRYDSGENNKSNIARTSLPKSKSWNSSTPYNGSKSTSSNVQPVQSSPKTSLKKKN